MERKHFLIVLTVCLLVWVVLFINGSLVNKEHSYHAWRAAFPKLGTMSSPNVADLTGDGVGDIVIGAGQKPFAASDSAVIALDGADGRLLWHAGARAQLFGKAVFLDINLDETPDVVIGGRRAQLLAIDGASGEVIWRYQTQDTVISPTGYTRFAFYGPLLIPDQDGDGLEELLLSNGGNELAAPYSSVYRYPGVLLVISSRNGEVLAADVMPDGRETYMAPLVYPGDDTKELSIIFGTGGETIGGSLYRTSLTELMNNNISGARRLASIDDSGFIATPVLADINDDGASDILVCAYNGQIIAIDGRTDAVVWTTKVTNASTYSTPVAGRFTGDATPDLFGLFSRQHWEALPGTALQVLIDGATGRVEFIDSVGCGGMYAPVALETAEDESEEILVSINRYDCYQPHFEKAVHYLALFNLKTGENAPFYPVRYAKNIASTPWVGDMDEDAKLDVVFCSLNNTREFFQEKGIYIERLATDIDVSRMLKDPLNE